MDWQDGGLHGVCFSRQYRDRCLYCLRVAKQLWTCAPDNCFTKLSVFTIWLWHRSCLDAKCNGSGHGYCRDRWHSTLTLHQNSLRLKFLSVASPTETHRCSDLWYIPRAGYQFLVTHEPLISSWLSYPPLLLGKMPLTCRNASGMKGSQSMENVAKLDAMKEVLLGHFSGFNWGPCVSGILPV